MARNGVLVVAASSRRPFVPKLYLFYIAQVLNRFLCPALEEMFLHVIILPTPLSLPPARLSVVDYIMYYHRNYICTYLNFVFLGVGNMIHPPARRRRTPFA